MKKFQKQMIGLSLIGLFAVAVLIGCEAKHPVVSSSQEKVLYQCSMHPQVVSDKPGNCPICGMRLTQVDQRHPATSAMPEKSSERKILFYRHPMQPAVTSLVPAKDEMGMDFIPVYQDERDPSTGSVPSHGSVRIQPQQQEMIGMKTAAVEEKPLVVKIRTLGRVGYDPDKFQSIAEYQEAAIAYRNYRGSPYTQIKDKVGMLHELAMLKLRLTGFSDKQIEGLMNTGQLVAHYSLEPDLHWLYADIYEYESQLVHVGDKAQVTAPSLPGKVFSGTVRSVDTVLYASNRILRARIELDPAKETLLPGATVDVEISASLGTKLAVPEDAVVDTGEQQIVFVSKKDGMIEPRAVQLGTEADSFYEVVSGLEKGEKVVSSATFLVDSESRLRAASQSFSQTAPPSAVSEMQQPAAEHHHGG